MSPSPKFRVATAVKSYVLTVPPYSAALYEIGVNQRTDPELVLDELEYLYGDAEVHAILTTVLKLKPELKPLAEQVFTV